MLTRKALIETLSGIRSDLKELDLNPERMVLFGSYANGGVHEHSDIDVAIWHKKFTGDIMGDLELIRPILQKYRGLDLKTYPLGARHDDFDPFIRVVEETGIDLLGNSAYNLARMSSSIQ
jgi:predicted nucleotidyltransferase